MKKWWDNLNLKKNGVFILLLSLFALACLFLPGTSSTAGGMTQEETRISATLSRIAGAGETRVSIYYAQAPSAFGASSQTPIGAVIVAQGAGDIGVKIQLIRAAETLLGLSPNSVEVFSMEGAP